MILEGSDEGTDLMSNNLEAGCLISLVNNQAKDANRQENIDNFE